MSRLFDSQNGGGMASYKRGGKVKKTGLAKLHKGEYVETKKEAKSHRSHRGKR